MRRISFKTVAVFLTVFLIGLTLQLPSYHQLPQPSHDATYRDAIQNVEAIMIEEPTTQIKNHTSKKQRALVLALELSLNELDLQNESDTAAAAASSLAKSQPQKSRLLIGVLTDPKSLHTIGMAACITWGREVQEFADVIFFVGSCEATKGKQRFPGRVVCLDTPDVYPPQRKVFLLWQYMWKNFANEYEYFMKVDHDTYLNFRGVRSLLATVTTPAYTSQCSYIGMTATGRKEEQGRLGLSGRPYCSGLGYMMNTACLVGLGPHLGDCAATPVSNHSDTEVGRCVMKFQNTECTAIPGYDFMQMYYQQDGSRVYPMKLITNGQMKLTFPREPKAPHFAATLLHPLKRAQDFYRFHKQTMAMLRPVQPKISSASAKASFKLAMLDLTTTCVHNPQRQKERGLFALPECKAPFHAHNVTMPTHAFVLTRHVDGAEESFNRTRDVLSNAGFAVEKNVAIGWSGWDFREDDKDKRKLNNLNYMKRFYDVMKSAYETNADHVLIAEDHVIFVCNFKQQLMKTLNSERCGHHLFSANEGGILLLGANEPTSTGMSAIETDRSGTFADSSDVNQVLCYNIHGDVSGSLAAIYHRAVFGEVLSWLSTVIKEDIDVVAFNSLFVHLADKGYIVRAAYPNLVLPFATKDPRQSEETDTAKIAVKLRWYQGSYCDSNGSHLWE